MSKEFLEAVVPPGTIVLARRVQRTKPDGAVFWTFAHRALKLHGDAVAAIEEMAGGREDVYYALASYKQGFHTNAAGKKVVRVRENVEALKALWFDIDFKGEYPDAKTAILALRAFSQATHLPSPSFVVGSGNGVHAYWPFTVPVPPDRWQRMADALKEAAKEKGLAADLACTADACRVLRPPDTTNWKDPANPKAVRLLWSSGKLNEPEQLEGILAPWFTAARHHVPATPPAPVYDEFTGGLVQREKVISRFDEIIKHCGVARHHADNHGKDAVEPEWTGMLQLLKHCEDGSLWVHSISDGHPGYNAGDTDTKWQQRLANSAGPTLCKTFEGYRPAICQKCPHNGFVKTPLQVGVEGTQSMDGLPPGWRVAANDAGIERMMIIDLGEGKTEREWVRVMRHIPSNLRATRSVLTGSYELQVDITTKGASPWSVNLPGIAFGNPRKLSELLADRGLLFKEREQKSFLELMTTWLEKLQAARRVADVTEQLGWLVTEEEHERKIIGFSAGPSTFYRDGRVRNDVRSSREFQAVAKLYEPRGGLDAWKKVAGFIAEQNNPAFTAILAAAFGAPLLKFTGQSGAILSIVSTASGVGKSSALKCSQAVWGSPTHGMNSVDDTTKSVARKLGFLNNLPAYWDELRGQKTVEDFLQLAFQITSGKERSRLDSSAAMRDTATWETLVVVASNESLFDAMGRRSGGSDAGMVRTFEMFVEPFESDRNRAELSIMFESVGHNYGHAGRVYAQYIATHVEEVERRVGDTYAKLAKADGMAAAERFWFAIVAVLLVGAQIAGELGLVKIDIRSLGGYLMRTVAKLRGRTIEQTESSSSREVLAAFMQTYQDRMLMLDKLPRPRQNTASYLPEILGGTGPRGDKLMYVVSRDDKVVRFPMGALIDWLEFRKMPVYTTVKHLRAELDAKDVRCQLGIGTKWVLPSTKCLEVSTEKLDHDFAAVAVQALTPGDLSSPAESPDSLIETSP